LLIVSTTVKGLTTYLDNMIQRRTNVISNITWRDP
jgi:hypothetical protein